MKGGDFSWPPMGTFRGHQRGPQLATSGYFLMATDTLRALHCAKFVVALGLMRIARAQQLCANRCVDRSSCVRTDITM